MTASMYRKHTLFFFHHTTMMSLKAGCLTLVVHDVFIAGDQNNFYYHEMKNLNQSFETEEQALCFGFISGRVGLPNISPMLQ